MTTTARSSDVLEVFFDAAQIRHDAHHLQARKQGAIGVSRRSHEVLELGQAFPVGRRCRLHRVGISLLRVEIAKESITLRHDVEIDDAAEESCARTLSGISRQQGFLRVSVFKIIQNHHRLGNRLVTNIESRHFTERIDLQIFR